MTIANLDKRIDDDGILLDAQLEWEHEEGKRKVLFWKRSDKISQMISRKRFLRSMYQSFVFSSLFERNQF